MSALVHKRTSYALFEDLVRTPNQRVRDINAECLGRLQVDLHLDPSRLLDRQIGGLVTIENAASINAGQAVCVCGGRSVRKQTSGSGELAACEGGRHRVTQGQCGEPLAAAAKQSSAADHEPFRAQLLRLCEG